MPEEVVSMVLVAWRVMEVLGFNLGADPDR
jgi:hypothetical protein